MMGRSYEETVQILIKSLRSAESQTRIEIMLTLEKVTFFPIKIFIQYALNMLGNTILNRLLFFFFLSFFVCVCVCVCVFA